MASPSETEKEIVPTCDEELDSLMKAGENAAEFIAAVVKFENRRQQMSDPTKNVPDRYILSNLSGRQFRLLIWPPRAKEFRDRLLKQVVEVTRARVQPLNEEFMRPQDNNLMRFEVVVQAKTEIKILKPMDEETEIQKEFLEVQLSKVANFCGKFVSVKGYIKTEINHVVIKGYSFGSGAITDLRYRLPVQVTTFDIKQPIYKCGTQVIVRGKIRMNEYNNIMLELESLDYVEEIPGKGVTKEEMKLGYLPVKTLSINSEESEPAKKKMFADGS